MATKKTNKRMDRGSRKRFKKGLIIYLLVLCLILAGALVYLWRFLAGYQLRQDALAAEAAQLAEQQAYEKAVYRAPQLCFEEFMKGADADYWTSEWYASNPDSLDKREVVSEEFSRLFFSEDTACFKAKDFDPTAPVYIVKNGDVELASVTLQGSELNWSVKDVHISLVPENSASIEVPTGCIVSCNGQTLSPESSTAPHTYFPNEELVDQLKNPILWSTYTVDKLLFKPELNVQSPADRTAVTDAANNISYILSADAASQYQKQGEDFVKTLLFYYMRGANDTYANMQKVLALLVNGSPAYKVVSDTYNGVTWDATYFDATYEASAGDVVIWADNCMSMDVEYKSVGTLGGYTNTASGTYTLYFFDSGKGFGIYAFSYK